MTLLEYSSRVAYDCSISISAVPDPLVKCELLVLKGPFVLVPTTAPTGAWLGTKASAMAQSHILPMPSPLSLVEARAREIG